MCRKHKLGLDMYSWFSMTIAANDVKFAPYGACGG